jgi:hypothetical protein
MKKLAWDKVSGGESGREYLRLTRLDRLLTLSYV